MCMSQCLLLCVRVGWGSGTVYVRLQVEPDVDLIFVCVKSDPLLCLTHRISYLAEHFSQF